MSEFQSRVLELTSKIPRGKVTTYKELARAMGRPRAYRAVGNALACNPYPGKIPCHRVVRSDRKIGGYGGSRLAGKKKERLLEDEGVEVVHGKVNLKKHMFRYR
jgi:methylated-DNA-[protein]-cysteine S-methyltransferase